MCAFSRVCLMKHSTHVVDKHMHHLTRYARPTKHMRSVLIEEMTINKRTQPWSPYLKQRMQCIAAATSQIPCSSSRLKWHARKSRKSQSLDPPGVRTWSVQGTGFDKKMYVFVFVLLSENRVECLE